MQNVPYYTNPSNTYYWPDVGPQLFKSGKSAYWIRLNADLMPRFKKGLKLVDRAD